MHVVGASQNVLPFTPGELPGYDNSSLNSTMINKLLGTTYNYERKNSTTGETEFLKLRCVKNGSGSTLTARTVVFGTTATWPGRIVSGQANSDGADGYVVYDGYNFTTGIPANEFFYIVEEGPNLVKTPSSATSRNVIGVNDRLVCGSTGSCHLRLAAGSDTLLEQIENVIGRAMTATTTDNTDTLIKAYISKAYPR